MPRVLYARLFGSTVRQGPRLIRICAWERVGAEQGGGDAERECVGAACSSSLCARIEAADAEVWCNF